MIRASKSSPKLFVKTLGSGPPVVLVHGGASSHRYWHKLAPVLAQSHQVIMPDLLGMGDSPKPPDCDYTLEDFVGTVEEALERNGIGGKYTLLAHSVGAIVGVAMAKRHPENIVNLVLSSPVFYTSPAQAKRLFGKAVSVPNFLLFGPTAWLSCQVFCRTKVVPRAIARLTFRNLPPKATNDVTAHTWKSYVGMRDNIIINQYALADLASLKGKVEVVVGTQDSSMEPAAINLIKTMPHVKLHQVPSGHNLPFSQTDLLIKLLTNP